MTTKFGGRRAAALIAGALCGAAFFAVGYRVLDVAHPAEDAYILFRYADNLAAGHGIVFNTAGPRAEGATDFLWLLMLAAGVRLGGDVAVVALVLNALGAALAGGLLARVCWGPEDRPAWLRLVLLAAAAPAACLAGGAIAGYWGFSSMLYSALVLLLFTVSTDAAGRTLIAIPLLATVVALFRPDGVIIGAAFVMLGVWRAASEHRLPLYLRVCGVCGATAVAYAAWRWSYFGLPLPLPLYVKQNAPAADGLAQWLPGLGSNAQWFVDGLGPHFITMTLAGVIVAGRAWRDERARRLTVFMIPVALHLAVLALAVQSQNIEFRFQAPAHLVLLSVLVQLSATLAEQRRTSVAAWAVVGVTALAASAPNRAGALAVERHVAGTWRTYVEAFAPYFGPQMDRTSVVALTEAGAVPYWTSAEVADIVGLNYPDAAVRPVSVADLARLAPDLVFLHQGNSLINEVLVPTPVPGEHVYAVPPQRLLEAMKPERSRVVRQRPTEYRGLGLLNVEYAATVMLQFLGESQAYDVFVVDPTARRTFVHVWGVRKQWVRHDEAIEAIRWALVPGNYRSYLAVRDGGRTPHNESRLNTDSGMDRRTSMTTRQ